MAIPCSALAKCYNMYQRSLRFLAAETILIFIILQIFVQVSFCDHDFAFVAQPSDVSVEEGGTASFNCTLKSSSPFSVARSHWENGYTEPIYQSDMYNVSTTSDSNNRTISSHLTIYHVRRDMSSLYKCLIKMIVKDVSRNPVSSMFATLNVLYFIKDNALACRGPVDSILQEYDQVTIECKGVQTNPQAVLRWLKPLSVSSSFSQTASLLIGNLTVSTLLHNKVLTCIAESEAFPRHQVKCSLGPYKVIHSPVVEVIPHQAEMIWPLITEMTFQCIAKGYPEVDRYNWLCHPEELFAQCTSHSQNITIILDVIQTVQTLNISCEATNDIATSRNNSIVNITYASEHLLDVCKSNSSYLQGMTEKGFPALFYDDNSDTLKCLVEVNSVVDEVTFQWYLDGHLVAHNREFDQALIKSSEGNSHLLAYNIIKVTGRGIVACNIITPESNILSFDYLVACNLSSVDVEDPEITSITESWQGTNGQNEHWTTILIAVPIASGFCLLFCLILVILAWQKSAVRRTLETQASSNDVPLTDFEDIQSSTHGSPSCNQDEIPVYEIPDVDLGRPTSRKYALTVPNCAPGGSRINIDSYLEEQEEQEEQEDGRRIGGGGGGGGGGEESFSESTAESCSSAEIQDMSFLSDDLNENDFPGLYNDYENGKVVESVVGNSKSRYFRAKMAESVE